MFAESMLETSWGQRRSQTWTTVTSFGAQAVVIGLLLLLPLWKTVGLPPARLVATPVTLASPPPLGPVVGHQNVGTIVPNNFDLNVIMAPPETPKDIAMTDEPSAPPVIGSSPWGVRGGTGNGNGDVWRALGEVAARPVPLPVPAPAPIARVFRSSDLLAGSLVRRVQPVYPALARSARIQGTVVLSAVISKAGTIENVRVVSGHPLLVRAAMEAVSQWRYRPYILNHEPIEVETQIIVSFWLSGN
ncbi:MAG TPA: energy transducer TonB [Candidatus Sulfotelmatobacter sp.]|nr:energy transducer TonB [Candidatus Sulfotelmatobacter sp.]